MPAGITTRKKVDERNYPPFQGIDLVFVPTLTLSTSVVIWAPAYDRDIVIDEVVFRCATAGGSTITLKRTPSGTDPAAAGPPPDVLTAAATPVAFTDVVFSFVEDSLTVAAPRKLRRGTQASPNLREALSATISAGGNITNVSFYIRYHSTGGE